MAVHVKATIRRHGIFVKGFMRKAPHRGARVRNGKYVRRRHRTYGRR